MSGEGKRAIIERWIAAMNTHDAADFLMFFTDDAVLDDPSVGRRFEHREGIKEYFDAYFVGYNTQTRLVRMTSEGSHAHVEVDFTGDFPGGQTAGIFDVTFTADKLSLVHADLA